jgi:DNA-binding transcriptional LysR family regulator
VTPLCLTVGYVPGVTPAKWARTWAERHPEVPLRLHAVAAASAADALRADTIDVALLRPPVDTPEVAVIPLYEETTVVVVSTDHLLSAADAVTVADLDGEPILIPLDDVVAWAAAPGVRVDHRPETTKDATELVAGGIGVLIVPQSLARLHHRKDLVYRPITDAANPVRREGDPSRPRNAPHGRRPSPSRLPAPPPARSPASRAAPSAVDADVTCRYQGWQGHLVATAARSTSPRRWTHRTAVAA